MRVAMIRQLSNEQLELCLGAYRDLQATYEDFFGGPYKAVVQREYIVICNTMEDIRHELYNRNNRNISGKETEGSSD